jgi:hypothetical protein
MATPGNAFWGNRYPRTGIRGSSSGSQCRYASIRRGESRPTRRQARPAPTQLPGLPRGYDSTDPQVATTRTITQSPPQARPLWASISPQAKVFPHRLRARMRRLVRAETLPAIRWSHDQLMSSRQPAASAEGRCRANRLGMLKKTVEREALHLEFTGFSQRLKAQKGC